MAGGNQGQGKRPEGQGQGGNAHQQGGGAQQQGGAGNPIKETVQNLSQNVQHSVEQAAGRLREGYGPARDEVARRYRSAEGSIARNPTPSVLIGFGVGFGLGLALSALFSRHEETWSEKAEGYLPDSLRNLPESIRNMRVPDSVRDAHLPASFHHLAESIRDLPSAIAKVVHGR